MIIVVRVCAVTLLVENSRVGPNSTGTYNNSILHVAFFFFQISHL